MTYVLLVLLLYILQVASLFKERSFCIEGKASTENKIHGEICASEGGLSVAESVKASMT